MSYKIEKQIRGGLPLVGYPPYGQIHAHSTGNRASTAQDEADYMGHKDINGGFYTHVVGNGRVIQVGNVNRGAWDVGGGWNQWSYASVELIESHKTKEEFLRDYRIYVTLLRDLAKEAGIRQTLDTGELGIITHDYARQHQPYNQTDHVDPYPYLAKWGISKAQFKKDVEQGISGGGTVTPTPPPTSSFDINNYHTKQFKQIILVKADYAYKEKELKNKVGNINPKGSIFTVVGIEYAGKYPRFKLKSGLYITTRKDTVAEYTGGTSSNPAPAPSTGKWIAEKGRFFVGEPTAGAKNVAVSSLPLTVNATGSGAKIADIGKGQAVDYDALMNDGKYLWIRQPRGNSYGYMATGNVTNGKRSDYWGRFTGR